MAAEVEWSGNAAPQSAAAASSPPASTASATSATAGSSPQPGEYLYVRNVGGFIADVVVEEIHNDEMEITRHPVETGSLITDHAFVRPGSVILRLGWSDSTFLSGGEGSSRLIYAGLRALQASRLPMCCWTGKRAYRDMLIHRISTRTDQETEYALMLELELEQIIIVRSVAVKVDPAKQANPADTTPTKDEGPQQATPVTNQSVLSKLANGPATPNASASSGVHDK